MADRRLILDSSALSALAQGDPRAIAWAYRATEHKMLYGIPAPVLAETLTGQPRDANIHRAIPSPELVLDTTMGIAGMAGSLRYRAKRPEKTIDAIVVATAAKHPGSIVLTGDPKDLTLLASFCSDARLAIRSVNMGPTRK